MSENNTTYLVTYSEIDEITKLYANAVVGFFRRPASTPQNVTAIESFGSGFFLKYDQNTFLVTAYHVLKEIELSDTILRTAYGSIPLVNIRFAADEEADIAISLIDCNSVKDHITQFDTVPSSRLADCCVDTPVSLFIGYPNTQNKIDMRSNKRKLRCTSISLIEKEIELDDLSTISYPRYFSFRRNNTVAGMNVSPGSRVAPYPYGMSGGPVLQICKNLTGNTLHASLIGVVAEWRQRSSSLVAANSIFIPGIIRHILK